MNWSSFFSGAVFSAVLVAGLFLTVPTEDDSWKVCPEAQQGHQLLVTVQTPAGNVECHYVRNVFKKQGKVKS